MSHEFTLQLEPIGADRLINLNSNSGVSELARITEEITRLTSQTVYVQDGFLFVNFCVDDAKTSLLEEINAAIRMLKESSFVYVSRVTYPTQALNDLNEDIFVQKNLRLEEEFTDREKEYISR